MEIKFFDKNLVRSLYELDKQTIPRVLQMIDLLREFGHELAMPHSKKVHNNLFELRVYGKQKVRIFYTFYFDCAVLLHLFVKKTQKISKNEMDLARKKLGGLYKV